MLALAPTRQSWSGHRTLATIPPAASGCWRAAIRAIESRRGHVVVHGCRTLARHELAGLLKVGLVAGTVFGGGLLDVGDPSSEAARVAGRIGLQLRHEAPADRRGRVCEPLHLKLRPARESAVVTAVEALVHAEEAVVAVAAEVAQAALSDGRHHGQLVRQASIGGGTGHPAGEPFLRRAVARVERRAGLIEVRRGGAALGQGGRGAHENGNERRREQRLSGAQTRIVPRRAVSPPRAGTHGAGP